MLQVFILMSASSKWSIKGRDFPANGSPRQKLEFALNYAVLAPTKSNWQPWQFRVTDAHLELMVENDPALEAIDPDGRELLIGCGAALQYLKLGLKHFGCLGQVALFPDLGEPSLVARIYLGFCRERDMQEKHLFEAMDTTRAKISSWGETPVSETMLAALGRAAAGERGWLDFAQSKMSRQHVMEVSLADDEPEVSFSHSPARTTTAATRERTPRWPRPLFAFGGHETNSWNGEDESVDPSGISTTTLAIVKTKTDDKQGWLTAGQTMARTVLQAQALGLSWAFFNPVRRREVREELRMSVGHKGFAQVILRFGPLTDGEMIQAPVPMTAMPAFR
jgi:hypothetical protein